MCSREEQAHHRAVASKAASPPPRSRLGLPVSPDAVLVARQLAQAHGAAGVELVGGDADLGAEAELAAVGEAGGDVVEFI
jgi:hypothetical protein